MEWNDDEITAALRRIDPARDVTDDDIDIERGRAKLHAAIAARSRRRRVRTRRAVLIGGLAAAVATVLVVGLPFASLHTPPAAAYGPPPLPFTAIDEPVDEVIATAKDTLRHDRTGVDQPQREVYSSGWFASIWGNGQAQALAGITPENRHFVWHEDLSGLITATAGIPYRTDGTPEPAPSPTPGTFLYELPYAEGAFTGPFATPPTSDPAQLTAQLRESVAPTESGAVAVIDGTVSLLDAWTVPDDIHHTLLGLLEGDSDLTVEGTTVDRLGRPVTGLRATSHATPWFDDIVLISRDTGRIIGVERVYTGVRNELKIPTGTIVSYTLWEATQ